MNNAVATTFGLVVMHVLALLAVGYIIFHGITVTEAVLHLTFYFLGGLGITALYHRSWAHNAVKFNRGLEYFLAACSTLVVQMPARQWVESHLDHHKHTDDDLDPYNIQKGFWWAHFEWMLHPHQNNTKLPQRLEENPVVAWQQRYYWPICLTLNVAVPFVVGLMVGAPWWAFLLLSGLRIAIMSNVIFAVNSVCHYFGTRPFSKEHSARDVWWFPLALGEQYHNYHHTFPRDYRHGIRATDIDLTKWFIDAMARIGLAENLVATPQRQVDAAIAQANGTAPEPVRVAAE